MMERIEPCTCFYPDDKIGRLNIEVRLPGVNQKDVKLDMKSNSLCVSALRGQEIEYSGCFALSPEIEPDRAESKFEGDSLRIFAPMARGLEQKHLYRPQA